MTTDVIQHSRAYRRRRVMNWLPLGLTYALLYMGRYNLTVSKNAFGDLIHSNLGFPKCLSLCLSCADVSYELCGLRVSPRNRRIVVRPVMTYMPWLVIVPCGPVYLPNGSEDPLRQFLLREAISENLSVFVKDPIDGRVIK